MKYALIILLLFSAATARAEHDPNGSSSAGIQSAVDDALAAQSGIRKAEARATDDTVAQIQASSQQQIQALLAQAQTNFGSFATPHASAELTKDSDTPAPKEKVLEKDKLDKVGKPRNDASTDPMGYAMNKDTKPAPPSDQLANMADAKPGKDKGKDGKKKDDEYQKELKGIDAAYQTSVKGADDGYKKAISKVQTDKQYQSMIGGIDDSWDKTMQKYGMGPGVRIGDPHAAK